MKSNESFPLISAVLAKTALQRQSQICSAWVPPEDVNEHCRGAQCWPASAPITQPSRGTHFAHLRAKCGLREGRLFYFPHMASMEVSGISQVRKISVVKIKVSIPLTWYIHTYTHTCTLKKTSTTQFLDCKLYIYIYISLKTGENRNSFSLHIYVFTESHRI